MKAKDLTGQRFGKLTVLSLAEPVYTKAGKPARRWNCRCDCGNELVVLQSSLTSKNGTRSCGCSRSDYQRAHMEDLTGKRFGRLIVLSQEDLPEKQSNGNTVGWRCRCDCGKEIVATRKQLVNQGLKSCGCLLSDTARDKIKNNVLRHYKGTTISAINPNRSPNRNNTSGVKGVYWSKSEKKWTAKIGLQNKSITIGRFDTLEDAAKAREQAEKDIHAPIIAEYESDSRCGKPSKEECTEIRGEDLTGKRFGKLIVWGIDEPHYTSSGKRLKQWKCRCDCGNEISALHQALKQGEITSCGCNAKRYQMNERKYPKDLSGLRFGRLTVLERRDNKSAKEPYMHAYLCRCDCGTEKVVSRVALLNGSTKSCGCLRKENGKEKPLKNFKFFKGTCISAIKATGLTAANTSGARGVTKNKNGRYVAYIGFRNKTRYLGSFDTLEEAVAARYAAERLIYDDVIGEYDSQNASGAPQNDVEKNEDPSELTEPKEDDPQGSEDRPAVKKKRGRTPKDITGERFGKLVALHPAGYSLHVSVVWTCQCDCGNTVDVKLNHLTSGHTRQCRECGKAAKRRSPQQ